MSFFAAPGGGVVRYEVDDEDRHVLELADCAAARAHLDEVVRALSGAPAAERSVRVESRRLSDAARLVARGGDAGARTVLPEAPGYVSALSDVRLVATAATHTRSGDEIETTSVSVVDSPSHGLWLIDTAAGGDEQVAVGRASSGDVGRRLGALLDAVVAAS